MYGLRIDLQRVEESLRGRGVSAICTDDDGHLLVAAAQRPEGCDVHRVAAASRRAYPAPPCGSSTSTNSRCCRRENPTTKPCATSHAAPNRSHPSRSTCVRLFADVLYLDPATIDPEC